MTKVEQAILFAVNAHAGTTRKGKGTPYVLHPLEAAAVAGRVSENEDVLAAAILHDTVEDTSVTLEEIREQFGERVAFLVAGESENKREELPPEETWLIRKQETVAHLKQADRDTKIVCLGDKISNLREIANDKDTLGEAIWQRFHQKDPAMHRWYYASLLEILEEELGDIAPIREYRLLLHKIFD